MNIENLMTNVGNQEFQYSEESFEIEDHTGKKAVYKKSLGPKGYKPEYKKITDPK